MKLVIEVPDYEVNRKVKFLVLFFFLPVSKGGKCTIPYDFAIFLLNFLLKSEKKSK